MTEEQWLAIKNNDKDYDGQFFYALKTTKTVCRPSCTARTCNPKNVVIFRTFDEAIAQGFRPCQRCRPDQMNWEGARAELAEAAKKLIQEHFNEKFSLGYISSLLYINGSYLLRAFKEQTGHTLLWHHNYTRCEEAKTLLRRQELSISIVSNKVGYSTASHFTRVFKSIYGYTPTEYRKGYLNSLK